MTPYKINYTPQDIPVPEHPPPEQEVIIDPDPSIPNDDIVVASTGDVTRKYELPPRSTRVVPPRRYDPEFESQRSHYPIGKGNDERLFQTVVAFNAALYSSSLPRTTEEALCDPK